MLSETTHVLLERNGDAVVLHSMEACPDRLALGPDVGESLLVDTAELAALKASHSVCHTCRHLEVAAGADRVRFLLDSLRR
jgi:hypothetical protein